MNPKAWFLVGVRILGVWLLVDCVGELISLAQTRWGLIGLKTNLSSAYLLHAVGDLLAAVAFMWGAPWLTNLLDWPPMSPGQGACAGCGYDLRGGHDQCPECGRPTGADRSGRPVNQPAPSMGSQTSETQNVD